MSDRATLPIAGSIPELKIDFNFIEVLSRRRQDSGSLWGEVSTELIAKLIHYPTPALRNCLLRR